MKKIRLFFLLLALLTLLCACAPGEKTPATTVPTEPPMVDIGGTSLECGVQSLDLGTVPYELDKLIAASAELKNVTHIDLGATQLRSEELENLQAAYPNAQIEYSIGWLDMEIPIDVQILDLSAMSADQTNELLEILPLLPALQEINFVDENGVCAYGLEEISQLDRVREAYPDVYLRVCFELFGQTVTSEDERIEYYVVPIGNEGAEVVRQVLPYLRSCTYFLMDGCGVDYEILDQMRKDFPETKIVWRIWLVEEDYNSKLFLRCGSYLTDTHRIRTTYVTDKNSHLLNYCTETKYLDVGHVWALTQCEFLSYMPDLEACIIAITEITDIAPLANHEKLEYLELFSSDIADLSPLASCPNLEHLNISNMPKVTDISPLYGLTKLKRLRMVTSPKIPAEQKAEIEELLPNCEILKRDKWPTSGTWRYTDPAGTIKTERYELLCQQMEYTKDSLEYGIP